MAFLRAVGGGGGGDDWPDMTDAATIPINANRVTNVVTNGYKFIGSKQYIEIDGTLNFNVTSGTNYQITTTSIALLENITKSKVEMIIDGYYSNIGPRLVKNGDLYNLQLAVPLAINLTGKKCRIRILLEQ